MVARIIVDDTDAVLVKAVVEFLIDGVEVYDCGRRGANGKLEEEVWAPQDGLVEVERLERGGRLVGELRPPDGGWALRRRWR